MKHYSFFTRFASLRDQLREYLKASGVYYELSGENSFYYFSILADQNTAKQINDYLDTITITEK